MSPHDDLIGCFAKALAGGRLPPEFEETEEGRRRFAVYRNNRAHGLASALAARFPVIERLVGDDFFRALAGAFIERHPPASPVLSLWGEDFPAFLTGFGPVRALPYLAEVARLEWLRGMAFHAADHPAAEPADIAPAVRDPARYGLAFHPSVALFRARYAALAIWQANRRDAAPGQRLNAERPQSALIVRDPADRVLVLPVDCGQAAFLAALLEGQSLLAAAGEEGTDLQGLLVSLLRNGAVIGLRPVMSPP